MITPVVALPRDLKYPLRVCALRQVHCGGEGGLQNWTSKREEVEDPGGGLVLGGDHVEWGSTESRETLWLP